MFDFSSLRRGPEAKAGRLSPRLAGARRVRSNDIALVGIVLLAGGIAVLAGSPVVLGRVLITGGLWLAAAAFFGLART